MMNRKERRSREENGLGERVILSKEVNGIG